MGACVGVCGDRQAMSNPYASSGCVSAAVMLMGAFGSPRRVRGWSFGVAMGGQMGGFEWLGRRFGRPWVTWAAKCGSGGRSLYYSSVFVSDAWANNNVYLASRLSSPSQ